jgi:hypothetical protein
MFMGNYRTGVRACPDFGFEIFLKLLASADDAVL